MINNSTANIFAINQIMQTKISNDLFYAFEKYLIWLPKEVLSTLFIFARHFDLVFIIFMIQMTLATSAYGNEVGFKYVELF